MNTSESVHAFLALMCVMSISNLFMPSGSIGKLYVRSSALYVAKCQPMDRFQWLAHFTYVLDIYELIDIFQSCEHSAI